MHLGIPDFQILALFSLNNEILYWFHYTDHTLTIRSLLILFYGYTPSFQPQECFTDLCLIFFYRFSIQDWRDLLKNCLNLLNFSQITVLLLSRFQFVKLNKPWRRVNIFTRSRWLKTYHISHTSWLTNWKLLSKFTVDLNFFRNLLIPS